MGLGGPSGFGFLVFFSIQKQLLCVCVCVYVKPVSPTCVRLGSDQKSFFITVDL